MVDLFAEPAEATDGILVRQHRQPREDLIEVIQAHPELRRQAAAEARAKA